MNLLIVIRNSFLFHHLCATALSCTTLDLRGSRCYTPSQKKKNLKVAYEKMWDPLGRNQIGEY